MNIPSHIAIIMDGNRRWAKQNGKHILAGHKLVVDKVMEDLIEHASDLGISYVTLWAWSTENWKRTADEVKGVMFLFKHVLSRSVEKLNKKGVKIVVIGDTVGFSPDIQKGITKAIEKTKNNTKITVVLALNYGGRDEIIRAVNKLITNHQSLITKTDFSQFLDTADIPDPDLIIRTGGDKRLSGFLLWQSEYAELYFTDVLMPDFGPLELDKALKEYALRKRRFGK